MAPQAGKGKAPVFESSCGWPGAPHCFDHPRTGCLADQRSWAMPTYLRAPGPSSLLARPRQRADPPRLPVVIKVPGPEWNVVVARPDEEAADRALVHGSRGTIRQLLAWVSNDGSETHAGLLAES